MTAAGASCAAFAALVLGLGMVPLAGLVPLLAAAGFLYGLSSASRDLVVNRAAPAGATGKVYGLFVYSGLDVGQMTMPVFNLLDRKGLEAVI